MNFKLAFTVIMNFIAFMAALCGCIMMTEAKVFDAAGYAGFAAVFHYVASKVRA